MLENISGNSCFFVQEKLKSAGFLRERGFFAVFLALWGEKGALFARRFPYSVSLLPYSVDWHNKAVSGWPYCICEYPYPVVLREGESARNLYERSSMRAFSGAEKLDFL